MSDGGPKKRTSSGFHFLAGLGSGVASAFLLQPADLLKTRVQQTQAPSLRHALRVVLDGPHPLRALWRGTTPSVIRTGAGSALYFGMLNQMRQALARSGAVATGAGSSSSRPGVVSASSSALPKLSHVANLSTGALARVAAGFALNPVTVLKVRYESTHYAYSSLAGAARDIVAREGLRGFFAGFGATAVRDAPYAGLYVLVYEQAKATLGAWSSGRAVASAAAAATAGGRSHAPEVVAVAAGAAEGDAAASLPPPPPPSPAAAGPRGTAGSAVTVNFASGVIAAVSATAMTNPFDAIKTRLQLAPHRYRNLMQAARTMLREEGVRSMFSGLSLRIGRKALSSALTWTVYEELIRRAETALV